MPILIYWQDRLTDSIGKGARWQGVGRQWRDEDWWWKSIMERVWHVPCYFDYKSVDSLWTTTTAHTFTHIQSAEMTIITIIINAAFPLLWLCHKALSDQGFEGECAYSNGNNDNHPVTDTMANKWRGIGEWGRARMTCAYLYSYSSNHLFNNLYFNITVLLLWLYFP